MSRLANNLMQKGFLKTDLVIEAFSEIGRVEFVPERFSHVAEENIALPIGHGHTAPAPSVTAFMIELLAPQKGHSILIVGGGTGWSTALLSYVVGATGHVTAINELEGLHMTGKENIEKYNFIARDNIAQCEHGALDSGYPDRAPYDCIFIAKDFSDVPNVLYDQLAEGGHMVLPLNDVITYVTKEGSEPKKEVFHGMFFSRS